MSAANASPAGRSHQKKPSDRVTKVSERWFKLLLRLYPADFRDEMGDALVETHRDRLREASNDGGAFRVASVWFGALRDSLLNGLGERMRPAVSWRRAGDWGRDMEKAGRRLRQKPLFLLAVLATLTVGLGTFAVVYTAVDKILLVPLPYKDPGDLYMVWCKTKTLPHFMLTGPQIEGLQKAGGMIEAAAGLSFGGGILLSGAEKDAVRLRTLAASPNLFELLGVHTAIGRGFRPGDIDSNAPNVVVLSDRLWRHLGGDPAILGTELKISATAFTIIGVMPPGFDFGGSDADVKPDVYYPADFRGQDPKSSNYLAVIRARHGTSLGDVHRQVDAVGRFVDEHDLKWGQTLFPVGLQTEMVNEIRPALLALSFAGVFLVLVLTVNLASLLLARAAEREREHAVSRALGASGSAVVRATLVEGALLGFGGGVTGALAGIWGTRMLILLGPADLPRRETIAVDWGVAMVVIAVGALLGLIAAAVPAAWASRASLGSLLSASAVRGGAGSSRMRRGLIVVQVAFSLVLLSSAAFVVRSFERLLAADPGFKSEGVLTFELGFGGQWMFPKNADMFSFQDRVDAALRALPGVKGVSATTQLPLSGGQNVATVEIPGAPGNTGDPARDRRTVGRIFTRAGYVEALGMRLIEGREFQAVYHEGVREVLIDRHLARQFFPNGSALGAALLSGDEPMTVVGVVDQARLYDLHQDDSIPQFFVRAEDYPGRRPSLYVVRTDRDPLALMPEVRAVIRQIDRRVPVSNVRTMDGIVAEKRSEERISAILIAWLALGAMVLVSMGLFGVISGSVARRRGELAVRLALGATHGRVVLLVVGEGARLIALGLLLGIPGIFMSSRAIQGLLVLVSPFDTNTLATAAIILVAVALLACYLAARRVTDIEPSLILKEEG